MTATSPRYFLGFFSALREFKVPVTLTEWMTFMKALDKGLHDHSLDGFYELARTILVKSETHFDGFDLAFQKYFKGLDIPPPPSIRDEILEWLKDPMVQALIPPEMLEGIEQKTLDELLEMLEERLRTQEGRHDGGNRWIGTGGTSPFGHSGSAAVPGIRVGGPGGSRSAIAVAGERRFRNYRSDMILDVRQLKVALRKLRVFVRDGAEEELDLDGTIDKTCRNGGEIDLVWRKSRKNRVKVLLLMDTGGSMTPYASMVNRLFSASHQSSHFKDFKHYFFHNCPYGKLYTDYWKGEHIETDQVLKDLDRNYRVILVGDACMAPYELHHHWFGEGKVTGVGYLQAIRSHFDAAVWLNPEAEQYWNHPTIKEIGAIFPMFPLTLDGLDEAIRKLRVWK